MNQVQKDSHLETLTPPDKSYNETIKIYTYENEEEEEGQLQFILIL